MKKVFLIFKDSFFVVKILTTLLSSIIAFCCTEIHELSVKSRQVSSAYVTILPFIFMLHITHTDNIIKNVQQKI